MKTQDEYFDMVKNARGWKHPINCELMVEEKEIPLIEAAIHQKTGSRDIRHTTLPNGNTNFIAEGYYNANPYGFHTD
jgi:hypothetical protein